MKISNSDGFTGGDFGKAELPELHGHVKLRVWNPKTHKTDFEFEDDNIVTDAIPTILSRNIAGALKYGSLLPLADKWFGGVLAFRNAFSTVTIDGNVVPDPSKYFPDNEDTNPCIAHAGDVAPATSAIVQQDLKRGSPTDVVKTGSTVKHQWQWLPSQGNGIINSLGLCHVDTGNAGIGSTSDAFKAFQPWANLTGSDLGSADYSFSGIETMFAQYDDNHGLYFHIGENSDWYVGNSSFTTKKLTVQIRRFPFSKVGLHETQNVISLGEREFTVTLTENLYVQPSYYFDYTNKYLWIFNNITSVMPSYGTTTFSWTNSSVNYAVIDCENGTIVDEGTITSNTSDLAPTSMQTWESTSYADTVAKWMNTNIIVDGDYVYLPTSDGVDFGMRSRLCSPNIKGLKKINMTDSSDQTSISFNDIQTYFRPSMLCGGLLINDGRIVNGTTGYSCATQTPFGGFGVRYFTASALTNPHDISSFLNVVGTGNSSGSASRYIFASKLALTTKFNLPSQVEKTGVQAMTVEYTLTEQ